MNVTMVLTGITHALQENANFQVWAYTKCLVRVDWEGSFLDSYYEDGKVRQGRGRQTHKDIDCMACIAKEVET